jgi:hypothetical protein
MQISTIKTMIDKLNPSEPELSDSSQQRCPKPPYLISSAAEEKY